MSSRDLKGTMKVGGAAPGTKDDAGKKVKKAKRVAYPLVGSKDPAVYPLKEVPADFNAKTHKPLKKKDFAEDYLFFSYKAAEARAKADAWDARAKEEKQLGSSKKRAQAKKLLKMTAKMAELRKMLEADGVDVDELIEAAEKDSK